MMMNTLLIISKCMQVRPLLRPKNLYYAQNTHPISSKFHLSKWKTYFSEFIDKFLTIELWKSGMGYSRKNPNRGKGEGGGLGWGYGISRGIIRNSMCNFRGQLKTKWDFRGWTSKNKVDGVFAFGLGISKGSNTILWNIQRLSFVLSGICWGKVKKMKNSREVFKKVYPQPSCLDFFLE